MVPPTRTKMPPSKMNRKDRRKAERKLKKARNNAFAHREFESMKTLKNIDTVFKAKNEQEKLVRLKEKTKKKTAQKKEAKREVEKSRIEGLNLAIQRDDKELKVLEKNLKFKKRKGKVSIPKSFMNDGLDYILDATDSEKIKDFDDVGLNLEDLEDSEFDEDFSDAPPEELEMKSKVNEQDEGEIEKVAKPILKSDSSKSLHGKAVRFQTDSSDEQNDETDLEGEEEMEEDVDEDSDDDSEQEGPLLKEDDDSKNSEDEDEDEDENSTEENEIPVAEARVKGKKRKSVELKEDIYGRLRDSEGNVVKPASAGAYIPPAKRAMMAGKSNAELHRRLKGLVNKVSESAMHAISSQIVSLYLDNSRADVNETLMDLYMEAIVTPILAPERMVTEMAMLVAILHANVGSEVGAFFLQKIAKKFEECLDLPHYGGGKLVDNALLLLSNLYNFKVVHSNLIYNIIDRLVSTFNEKDIELLLLILKTVGFRLRKDDPAKLKQAVLDIQAKASEADKSGAVESTRVQFMLDVLLAVRNNNMRKIPSYDPTHLEHLTKVIKSMIKGHNLGDDQLNISLKDLLKADEHGKWWIVGSAWGGLLEDEAVVKEAKAKTETIKDHSSMDKQMLKLAKRQGMNSDIRRHIFCILGTSEDFEDAFAKLLRMGLNRSQEREIIHVMMHCCLNEKEYNPFYSFLAQKFCTFDRRFTITVQFSLWDKFKEVEKMDKEARSKLGHFVAHLIISKSLSLSLFKVVEFGMESKKMIRLLAQILHEVLSSPNTNTVKDIFERISPIVKLKHLRQGLQVFMRIHLKDKDGSSSSNQNLQQRIKLAETSMFSHQSSNMLL